MAEKTRKDAGKKKVRRRKNRRDVESSSSSSESSSNSDSDVPEKPTVVAVNGARKDVEMAEPDASDSSEDEVMAGQETTIQPKQVSEADFKSWYLRQVTKELEEDLDKIRSASDFKDSSLPILITALQQGTLLFSPVEKQRLLGAKS